MSEKNGDLLKGLIVGGLIGAIIGILYAPKKGKETRDDLARRTEDFLNKAREEFEKTMERTSSAYESAVKRFQEIELSAKEKVTKVEDKVNEIAQQSAETVQDNKNRLKKAIDAGVEAYREEKAKKPV